MRIVRGAAIVLLALAPSLMRAQDPARAVRISVQAGSFGQSRPFSQLYWDAPAGTPGRPYFARDGRVIDVRVEIPLRQRALTLELDGVRTSSMSLSQPKTGGPPLEERATVSTSSATVALRVAPQAACFRSICAHAAVGAGLKRYEFEAWQLWDDMILPFAPDQTVRTMVISGGVRVPLGRLRLNIEGLQTRNGVRYQYSIENQRSAHDLALLVGVSLPLR